MHVAACKHMWHVFQTSRQNIVLSIRQLIFCDSCSVSVGVGTPLIARLPNFQLVKMPLDIKLHPVPTRVENYGLPHPTVIM